MYKGVHESAEACLDISELHYMLTLGIAYSESSSMGVGAHRASLLSTPKQMKLSKALL